MEEEKKLDTELLEKIDIRSIVKDLLRESWVIVLFAIAISMFASVWMTSQYVPRYTAKTTFVVSGKEMNSSVYQNLSAARTLAERFAIILDSNVLKKKVMEDLDMKTFDVECSVNVIPETNMMEVHVTAGSAMEAFRVLQSIMNNYRQVSDYVIEEVILDVIQQPVVPNYPDNPLYVDGIMKKGFLAGAAILTLLVIVFSHMRDTVKNERQMEEKIDARYLGAVSHERKRKLFGRQKNISMLIENPLRSFKYVERNRMVASKIRSQLDRKNKQVILVTSVMENEGKSTVAANIALALAHENSRVLLIDGDFRKPSQYKIFEVDKKETVNLPAILKEKDSMENMITRQEESGLYTILNGKAASSLDGMKEQNVFKNILAKCKKEMDYIVIDTSPIALVSDAEELAQMVDASILVVRQDMVLAKDINDAIDILNNTKGKVLGCVLNNATSGMKAGKDMKGYGGKYGK